MNDSRDPPVQDGPARGGRSARLDDVALVAGVAKSTVSRVMSGEATLSVRAATRQRILEVAAELGYQPDSGARALRLRRTHTLGIVVPEIDNPAFGTIIRSAQKAAVARGYSLFISLADKDQPDGELYRRLVAGNRVDGVLVTTTSDPALVAELRRRSISYVLVNREIANEAASIIVDYVDGTMRAVAHLAGLGHRRLALISGPLQQYAGQKRLEGFRRGLAAAGLPFDPALVAETRYGWDEAGEALARMLAAPGEPPTAVCAANAVIASGAIARARRLGRAVPDDLSVAALMDAPLAAMNVPAITAVQYPFEELGRLAVDALIDRLEDGTEVASRTLAPVGLAERDSTAPARGR